MVMTPNEQAKLVTEHLFTTGLGEKAFRLLLIGPEGGELGSWNFDEAVKRIEGVIATYVLTEAQLRNIMPHLSIPKLSAYYPHLIKAMAEHEINTPLRAAAFLAQLAHESAELRFFEEIWGPTAAQQRYEGRADLGNTEPGDGKRFKGRGPIQLTGRANYKKYGDLLGVDFISNPELAAKPEWGFQTAGLYWKLNGCNKLADVENFVGVTRKINGGTNGHADREKYYEMAKKALGITEA
jgi:predicted chitinase